MNGKKILIGIAVAVVVFGVGFGAGYLSQRGALVGANDIIADQRRSISQGLRDVEQLKQYNQQLRNVDTSNRKLYSVIESESKRIRSDIEQLRSDNDELRDSNRGYIERQQRIEEIVKQIYLDNNRG